MKTKPSVSVYGVVRVDLSVCNTSTGDCIGTAAMMYEYGSMPSTDPLPQVEYGEPGCGTFRFNSVVYSDRIAAVTAALKWIDQVREQAEYTDPEPAKEVLP